MKSRWNNKLYWYQDGLNKRNGTYIPNFLKTVDIKIFEDIKSVGDLFKAVKKLSKDYADWAMPLAHLNTDKYRSDIETTFIGFMGEFFFLEVFLPNRRCYIQKASSYDTLDHKVCYNVNPYTEQDFGEDGYCIDHRGIPCAIQVKFWNPNSDEKLLMETFAKLDSQAMNNGHVQKDDTDNEIFCWLGDSNHITRWLRENKNLVKKAVFINKKCIDATLSNDISFWNILFINKMKELINL